MFRSIAAEINLKRKQEATTLQVFFVLFSRLVPPSGFYGTLLLPLMLLTTSNCKKKNYSRVFTFIRADWIAAGAIIGDGDRKRSPFLVLGLAPWYGTIFLFLEQIAPSPAAYARTCCEDFFADVAQGKWHPRFTRFQYAFGPQLNTFMSVGIWLKYFRRKLLQ